MSDSFEQTIQDIDAAIHRFDTVEHSSLFEVDPRETLGRDKTVFAKDSSRISPLLHDAPQGAQVANINLRHWK